MGTTKYANTNDDEDSSSCCCYYLRVKLQELLKWDDVYALDIKIYIYWYGYIGIIYNEPASIVQYKYHHIIIIITICWRKYTPAEITQHDIIILTWYGTAW